ncbi:MAG: gamma-glutamyl-gamma-aminobutyrate hydrolase family protein [Bacilli bacterium]
MKPIVGIIEWPYKDIDGDEVFEVLDALVNKVNENGGIPIGIFPTDTIGSLKHIKELNHTLSICDAFIKPGALRIYGYERYIYEYALTHNVPFLGICAGMQMMSKQVMEKNITNHRIDHKIKIIENTLLSEIIKEKEIIVNSKHNYHINDPGNLTICAMSNDGIIEGIYDENQLFHLGVQWHPELMNDKSSTLIFQKLIESARKNRK